MCEFGNFVVHLGNFGNFVVNLDNFLYDYTLISGLNDDGPEPCYPEIQVEWQWNITTLSGDAGGMTMEQSHTTKRSNQPDGWRPLQQTASNDKLSTWQGHENSHFHVGLHTWYRAAYQRELEISKSSCQSQAEPGRCRECMAACCSDAMMIIMMTHASVNIAEAISLNYGIILSCLNSSSNLTKPQIVRNMYIIKK
jgi:hypothetical protein